MAQLVINGYTVPGGRKRLAILRGIRVLREAGGRLRRGEFLRIITRDSDMSSSTSRRLTSPGPRSPEGFVWQVRNAYVDEVVLLPGVDEAGMTQAEAKEESDRLLVEEREAFGRRTLATVRKRLGVGIGDLVKVRLWAPGTLIDCAETIGILSDVDWGWLIVKTPNGEEQVLLNALSRLDE